MTAYIPRLSGTHWQEWANKLLTRHYGPADYQRIPDTHRGDAGLEGFTIKDGHAYQAYGCEGEPLKLQDRYVRQRDKMTADVAKFINNTALLQQLFGNIKINRWVLLVPYYDSKELVVHATKKTTEVLTAGVPYVTGSFRVMVCHEEDFVVERDQLINAGKRSLKLVSEAPTATDLTRWASAHDAQAATLEDKLARLPALDTPEKRAKFKQAVLAWYLEGQAILSALRRYPETYEKVVAAKSHRESLLAMDSAFGARPEEILRTSIDKLLETLKQEVRELHAFSAEKLTNEAVADWLLRCPLDFA